MSKVTIAVRVYDNTGEEHAIYTKAFHTDFLPTTVELPYKEENSKAVTTMSVPVDEINLNTTLNKTNASYLVIWLKDLNFQRDVLAKYNVNDLIRGLKTYPEWTELPFEYDRRLSI